MTELAPQWLLVFPDKVEPFRRFQAAISCFAESRATLDLLQFVHASRTWVVIAQRRDGVKVEGSAPLVASVLGFKVEA